MDKRTFLKTSSAIAGGVIFSRLVACRSTSDPERLRNWAGNLEYSTGNVYYPTSLEQIQELVKEKEKIKALGSRHSFSTIADSRFNLISLREMNRVVELDKSAHTVTVEPGIRYGELAKYLQENGYALHNLASLPHITVAGACATATHGSGVKNGNLSTAVSAIEFIDAQGGAVSLSRAANREEFEGAVVGLGALGVITKMTLDLLPAFNMKQVVYRNLPLHELEQNFEQIMSSGYSVSLFTNWRNKNINEIWIKSKAGEDAPNGPQYFGATLATENLHPVEEQSAESVTDQMGIEGPWYERMPHFKLNFTPSTGKELQSEYFIPFEHAYTAMAAVEKLSDRISPHLFISEIRTVAADNFWMSPCYKRACVAIHTTWKQDWDTVKSLLPLFEQQLAPFNPIPHWAKLTTLPSSVLRSRLERLNDFKQLVNTYDPQGKFRNEFLTDKLYAG